MSSEQNYKPGELPQPPMASEEQAAEVLRVWVSPGKEQQTTLKPMWEDVGLWGMMLAGVVRDVSAAYARKGHNEEEVFKRIFETFEAEFVVAHDVGDLSADGDTPPEQKN